MALNTVSSDRLSTNVKNTNFTAAEKQDLTDDILPLVGQIGNRNILHNGSFIVHQRGGTTTSPGFLLDRWYSAMNGGTATFSQGTETSGTVYEKGLVNYCRITNTANSTVSGAYRYLRQAIEAQNLLKSGWNYKSASAKITLSFYVRSSVAQNFYGYLRLSDSPDSRYTFETGSLTADTWTKVTKVIPGYASGNIDNDNGSGMEVLIAPFWGTDGTDSGVTLNTWAAFNGGQRFPDYATTWAGTNGATFDVTGVQLEVGSVATDFEHRSFGQELALCYRYFEQYNFTNFSYEAIMPSHNTNSSGGTLGVFPWRAEKRATPTVTLSADASFRLNGGGAGDTQATSMSISRTGKYTTKIDCNASRSQTTGHAGYISRQNTETTFIQIAAEL